MLRNILAVVVLLGLVIWGVLDYSGKYDASRAEAEQLHQEDGNIGVKKGKIAPDFELETLDGKQVKLSDYEGKKIVMNFWATWCGPCRAEMPHMEKYYKEFQTENVVLLGINLTHTERKKENIPDFVDEFGLTFPILLDPKAEVSEKYQVIAYPTTFIIDTKGVIRHIFYGPIDYNTLSNAVSRVR